MAENMLDNCFTSSFWAAARGRNTFTFDGVEFRVKDELVLNWSSIITFTTEFGKIEVHHYSEGEGCSGSLLFVDGREVARSTPYYIGPFL
jgi:hypothetical protein